MRSTPRIQENADKYRNVLTAVILGVVSLCIAFMIARGGEKGAAAIVAGVLGVAMLAMIILYPVVGFYLTILTGIFFADAKRFLAVDLPFGVLLDVLMILTFLSLLINRRMKGEAVLKFYDHPIVYVYMVIVCYSLLQVFNPNGGSMSNNLLILRRFIALQLFLFSAISFLSDTKKVAFFFKVWFVLALVAGLYGCYQEFAGYPPYELNYINSDPVLIELYESDTGGDFRKFSFLPDPTSFGILMAASAVIYIVTMLNLRQSFLLKTGIFLGVVVMALAMSFSEDDIPDLSGKTAVVTGATGGLGYETARMLAGAGAGVILAGRNAEKGAGALNRIRALHPRADIAFELLPNRFHRFTPLLALFGCQGDDFSGLGREYALLVTLVQLLRFLVHLGGDFYNDLLQFAANVWRQAVPELGVGDQHVVQYTVVGFSDVFLHFMHFLAVYIRVRVFRTVDHTGLQPLIDLGKTHLARIGAHSLELLFEHGRRLNPEFQATGIGRHAQCLVGRKLLHPVVPIGQAGDVFTFHGR